ncbi:MAG: HEAT repeat domain-containing protein [Armatimonadetes bacterium]|nr:HEAT repeat domain-containing protein [Armatimonadota bacterium]
MAIRLVSAGLAVLFLSLLTGCGESEAAKKAKIRGWVAQVKSNPAVADDSNFLAQLTDYADLTAPEFAKVLKENNKPVQLAALKVLAHLKRLSVYEDLVKLSRSPDPEIRQAVATTLGSFASPLTVKPLMALATDRDPSVKGAALKAMGQKADRDAPPYLREVLPYLTAGLDDPEPLVRRGAVQGLTSLGPWALQALAQVQKEGSPQAKAEAARALRYICESFRRDLRESTDRLVRRDMARYLSELRYRPAIPDLIEKLQDPDPEVKAACAYALGRLQAREALRRLSELLKNQKEEMPTRIAAAVALGQMGREEGVRFLISQLNSSDEKVRSASVDALRTVGRSAEKLLLPASKSRDPLVRWGAIAVLGTIGSPSALPVLKRAVSDKEPEVRAAAVAALGDLGDASAVPVLIAALSDKDRYVQAHAERALEEIGKPAVPHLVKALDRPTNLVRILRLLGRLKDPSAASQCRSFLQHRDHKVRSAAADALGDLEDRGSADALANLLNDRSASVRRAAATALGKIGSQEHLSLLRQRLRQEKNETTRSAIIAALAIGKTQ